MRYSSVSRTKRVMEIESDQCTSGWSGILPEILQLIQSKLPVPFLDVRTLYQVCAGWRDSVKVPRLSPLLLSLPSIYDFDKLRIFSPVDANSKVFNHSVLQRSKSFHKLIDNGFCVGFSYGWLVVLDKDLNLLLFNPFSGDEILLPDLDLGYGVLDVMDDPKLLVKFQCQFIKKAILSSDPAFGNDYKVIIIKGDSKCLASNGGDHRWFLLGYYTDISCYNKKLYALINDTTEVWDLNLVMSTSPRETIRPVKTIQINKGCPAVQLPWEKKAPKTYIVVSMKDIFYVHRYVVETEMLYKTVGFKVFRLDLSQNEKDLVEVSSLQNRCMFLGGNENRVIPCQEYPGFKGNCIYFLDDSRQKWIKPQYPYLGFDMGEYCLLKRRICLLNSLPCEPMPYWILPRKVVSMK